MNIITLVICGISLIATPVYSSFTLPIDSTPTIPKSALRNNILSSVAKVPSAKLAPTVDVPLKTEPVQGVMPLMNQSKALPKIQEPLVLKSETLPKTLSLTVQEPKASVLTVNPKSNVESSSLDVTKLAQFTLPQEEPKPLSLPKISDEMNVDKQKLEAGSDVQKVIHNPVVDDKAEKLNHNTADASAHEPLSEPGVLHQPKNIVDGDMATIAFNFEDASLLNLVSYIESVHNIKFIGEDVISTAKDAKGAAGHKITFRTNRNLTRQESWDLFLTFLHIAGLDVIPLVQQGFYRIVSLAKANNEPIPTYIGVDDELLPDSDMIVRYVYFARHVDPTKVQPMLKNMQSGSAKLDVYASLKGLIFTDRANSIKSLMRIVKELDKAVLPEALSVVKLQRANADDVVKLYESLAPKAGGTQPQRVWAGGKKEAMVDYFPSEVTLVPYNRMNSLIILGLAKDVQRVEEFITNHIDVQIDRSAPPIFTYRLQYTNATDLQPLLTTIVGYGKSTVAGQYGGVRDGMKFLQPMTIVPDKWTNSLVINAVPEDFAVLKPLIDELDVPQQQVAIEVLIVQVKDSDVKTLGAQLSAPNGFGAVAAGTNQFGPAFLQNVTAQTSGIYPGSSIVVTPPNPPGSAEDFSIKSSLASLLVGGINEAGSVLMTFGKPIWAIFKILKTITSTHIVANPFGVVSNNSTLQLISGEERRQTSGEVITSTATGAQAITKGFTPVQAKLHITITPQINKGNIINLNIDVKNQQFTASLSNGDSNTPRDLKEVTTIASVANGETLVLGGIMAEQSSSASVGVPFLENIPLLGWFFKSKTRTISRDHFMIFICPRLLDPAHDNTDVGQYTKYKLDEAEKHISMIDDSDWFASKKDPIQQAFFNSKDSKNLQQLHTGRQFAMREAIDGKIDQDKKLRPKKIDQKKKSKRLKKKQEEAIIKEDVIARENELRRTRNSISGSMQKTQGVPYVA